MGGFSFVGGPAIGELRGALVYCTCTAEATVFATKPVCRHISHLIRESFCIFVILLKPNSALKKKKKVEGKMPLNTLLLFVIYL